MISFRRDIVGHVGRLTEYAVRSRVMLELGVDAGDGSTAAFWAALKPLEPDGRMWISVDIVDNIAPDRRPNLPFWRFVRGDTTNPGLVAKVGRMMAGEVADLIFIDTTHTYEHLLAELNLWSELAAPDCVWLMHDTWAYGKYNLMTDAAKQFAAERGLVYTDITKGCHGLGGIHTAPLECDDG